MSEPAWVPIGPAAVADVGAEVAYAEITAPVSITATTEATAQVVATAPAFVADGSSQYVVEFSSPAVNPAGGSGSSIQLWLFLDGVSIGQLSYLNATGATAPLSPQRLSRRLTPAAGSRVFSVRACVSTGTGSVAAGPGGTPAQNVPAFIRITKVPSASPAGVAGSGPIPAGSVMPFAGAAAPSADWLVCNGAAVLRSAYPTLFTVIGVAYGAGDGTTTFNLPDLQGRVPVGLGTNAAVNALNKNDGVAVANRRPQHRHTAHSHTLPFAQDNLSGGSGGARPYVASGMSTGTADGGSGVATDSLDAPAYLVLNYLIKT